LQQQQNPTVLAHRSPSLLATMASLRLAPLTISTPLESARDLLLVPRKCNLSVTLILLTQKKKFLFVDFFAYPGTEKDTSVCLDLHYVCLVGCDLDGMLRLAGTDEENELLLYIWAAAAILIACCIHRAVFRSAPKDLSTGESRLLHQKFGVISDDTAHTAIEEFNETGVGNPGSASPPAELSTGMDTPKDSSAQIEPSHDGIVSSDEAIETSRKESAEEIPLEKNKKPKKSRTEMTRERLGGAALARVEHNRPQFLRTDDNHPGLQAFWHWCDVETSLFRIYTITRKDGVIDETTIAPYNPSSRRGSVPINLIVTNDFDEVIKVYWIDYKGKHISKGSISSNGGVWTQMTWIDHPWIFCVKDDVSGDERIVLHYIPYQTIPTTASGPNTGQQDDDMDHDSEEAGVHRFRILTSPVDSLYSCKVDDTIFPHPSSAHLLTPHKAAEFALLHCHRMRYNRWSVLKKYLSMILKHPENTLCRQIRIANPTFAESVWITPAKGVLLAAGFVEHEAYAELGSAGTLSQNTLRELSLLLYAIEIWEAKSK
jgi:PUB domain